MVSLNKYKDNLNSTYILSKDNPIYMCGRDKYSTD